MRTSDRTARVVRSRRDAACRDARLPRERGAVRARQSRGSADVGRGQMPWWASLSCPGRRRRPNDGAMSSRSPGGSGPTGACCWRRHSSRSSRRARVRCAGAPISSFRTCSRTTVRVLLAARARVGIRWSVRASRPPGRGRGHFRIESAKDLQHGVAHALGALGSSIGATAARGPLDSADPRLAPGRSGVRRSADRHLPHSLPALCRIAPLVPRDQPIYSSAYAVTTLCRTAATGAAAPAGLWESLAAVTRLSRSGCRTDDLIVRPFNGQLFARSAAPTLETPARSRRGTRASTIRDQAVRDALVVARHARGPRRPGGDLVRRPRRRAARRGLRARARSATRRARCCARACSPGPPQARGGRERRKPAAQSRPGGGARRAGSGNGRGPSTRRDRSRSSSFAGRWARSFAARPPTRFSRCASSIPRWGAAPFSSRHAAISQPRTSRRLIEEGRRVEADFDADARADVRRLIAEQCLAGVDVNPVAVQLARLSLWLTSLARGKPLGFLDHRLRTGNSLIGTTPDDLWRRRGRRRSDGTLPLFEAAQLEASLRDVAQPAQGADDAPRRRHRSRASQERDLAAADREPIAARVVAQCLRAVVRPLVLAGDRTTRRTRARNARRPTRSSAPRSTPC